MKTITFAVSDLLCCGDQQTIEQKLKLHPHIVDASVNFVTEKATVSYHEKMITGEDIKKLISDCGFHCRPLPLLSGKEALEIATHKMNYKEREKIIYTCPMHKEVTSDKPGSCPKCGMRLVPRRKQKSLK